MFKIAFHNISNIIFIISLKKLLFNKIVIYFIDNIITILFIKFCIFKVKIANL